MVRYFKLRPQVFLELYVQTNLWGDYLKTGATMPGKEAAPN